MTSPLFASAAMSAGCLILSPLQASPQTNAILAGTTNIVNIGQPTEFHLRPSDHVLTLREITLNGDMSIVIDPTTSRPGRVELSHITGPGGITIVGSELGSLEIEDVQIARLTVRVLAFGELRHTIGACHIGVLSVEARTIGAMSSWQGFTAPKVDISIGETMRRLSLKNARIQELSITSQENKIYPTLHECFVELSSAVDTAPMSHASTTVSISHLSCGHLAIHDATHPANPISIVPSIALKLEDIEMSEEKILDIDLRNFTPHMISVRDVGFFGAHFGSLTLHLGASAPEPGNLEMAMLRGIDALQISWEHPLRGLVLRDIETKSIKLGLPAAPTSADTVIIGGVVVRDGIDAPIDGMLALAGRNSSERPFDRAAFFRTIENVGYFQRPDGSIERAGLRALQLARTIELHQVSPVRRSFGFIIFWLTGLGTSVVQPVVTFVVLLLFFSVVYAVLLRRSAKLAPWQLTKTSLSLSWRATASLGSFNKDEVKSLLGKALPDAKDSLLATASRLAHAQALLFFLQMTLCSIFFSQTTLR
jgi:hypothetical protein